MVTLDTLFAHLLLLRSNSKSAVKNFN